MIAVLQRLITHPMVYDRLSLPVTVHEILVNAQTQKEGGEEVW